MDTEIGENLVLFKLDSEKPEVIFKNNNSKDLSKGVDVLTDQLVKTLTELA